jgi:hypothetical protein
LQTDKKICECGYAVAGQNFLKQLQSKISWTNCKYAVAEMLPSNRRVAVAEMKTNMFDGLSILHNARG